jgi:hypothetical protein
MRLIESTERYFYFDDYYGPPLNFEGIITKPGRHIQFAKGTSPDAAEFRNYFTSANDCLEYVAMLDAKKDFIPNSRIDKTFDLQIKGTDVTETDWEIIKSFMPRPDKITPEMVRTWETQVANNFPDRAADRFRKDALQSLSDTLVGKGKLTGHDRINPGDGLFYHSELKAYTVDEALAMIPGRTKKGFKERLQFIQSLDGAIYFATAKFYKSNVTEDEKTECRLIDMGINKYLSVGFTVPVYKPIYEKNSDNPKLMFCEFQNSDAAEVECLETSSVGLGAQIAAQVTKSYFPGVDFPETLIQTVVARTLESLSSVAKEMPPPAVKPPPPDFDPLAYYYEMFDLAAAGVTPDAEKAQWSAAYINTLEDNCFAAVEPGLDKDADGLTAPRNARHLPHHAKGNGAAGTGGTLDASHFNNALARMGQVKAVSSNVSTEDLRKKAENHLLAHKAKEEKSLTNTGVVMKLSLPALNIQEREFELTEPNFTAALDEITKSAAMLITERDAAKEFKANFEKAFPGISPEQVQQELTALKSFQSEMNQIFADQPLPEIKKQVAALDVFRKEMVNSTVTFAGLLNMFDHTNPELVATRKTVFGKMALTELLDLHASFSSAYEKEHPPQSKITPNLEKSSAPAVQTNLSKSII